MSKRIWSYINYLLINALINFSILVCTEYLDNFLKYCYYKTTWIIIQLPESDSGCIMSVMLTYSVI